MWANYSQASAMGSKYKLISEFYKYHFPSINSVVQEMDLIKRACDDADYQAPLNALEKSLFLLKVSQILFQHKQHERFIIPAIQEHLSYCLTKLLDFSGENAQDIVQAALSEVEEGSLGMERNVMTALETAVQRKYPTYVLRGKPEDLTSPCRWCLARLIRVPDCFTQQIMNCLHTDNYSYMVSLQNMSTVIKNLFVVQLIDRKAHDLDFNMYFNQAVFWVSVLRVYKEVIYQQLIEDNICLVLGLLKKQAVDFFTWFDLKRPPVLSEPLVRFMEHLLKQVSIKSSDVLLSEINTYLHHCKTILQRM